MQDRGTLAKGVEIAARGSGPAVRGSRPDRRAVIARSPLARSRFVSTVRRRATRRRPHQLEIVVGPRVDRGSAASVSPARCRSTAAIQSRSMSIARWSADALDRTAARKTASEPHPEILRQTACDECRHSGGGVGDVQEIQLGFDQLELHQQGPAVGLDYVDSGVKAGVWDERHDRCGE